MCIHILTVMLTYTLVRWLISADSAICKFRYFKCVVQYEAQCFVPIECLHYRGMNLICVLYSKLVTCFGWFLIGSGQNNQFSSVYILFIRYCVGFFINVRLLSASLKPWSGMAWHRTIKSHLFSTKTRDLEIQSCL